MERFRRAVEAGDPEAMVASVAEDVVFRSPLVFKPYVGRAAVAPLLRAVARVITDWECLDTLSSESQTALEFKAKVGDREVQGIDLGVVNAEGLLTQLTVFIRPFSGAQALGEALRVELEKDAR